MRNTFKTRLSQLELKNSAKIANKINPEDLNALQQISDFGKTESLEELESLRLQTVDFLEAKSEESDKAKLEVCRKMGLPPVIPMLNGLVQTELFMVKCAIQSKLAALEVN